MMVAGFDDLDAEGIDRVEFYHNGKLELVDGRLLIILGSSPQHLRP